jgi:hypothetical protein
MTIGLALFAHQFGDFAKLREVGIWRIASCQSVVMSAVAWHRTCRLRDGADKRCPIGQTERVRSGKCVHTEE